MQMYLIFQRELVDKWEKFPVFPHLVAAHSIDALSVTFTTLSSSLPHIHA
jgi:hypothetical protein